MVEKTIRVLTDRIAPAGASIIAERQVPHDQAALAKAIDELLKAGAEMVIVFGASAIADRRDVIPAALEAVGGTIDHFGMPVDPGNLLLIGRANDVPVIGAPGCARSPKENGFDWVLMRLLAGLPVAREDVTGMGVGGLLMEIVTRPQPREKAMQEGRKRIAAVVLAAGRSTRMGAVNKMIAEIGGKPLVRIAAEQALASQAAPVIVVTGHERDKVEAALKGLNVRFAHNPDYAEGLGTSLAHRHRCRAGQFRWRGGAAGRHAADRCEAHRQADRGVRSRARRAGRGADHRGTPRQPGRVGAAVLHRPDGRYRRCRRPAYHRQRAGSGRGSAGQRCVMHHGRRHAGRLWNRSAPASSAESSCGATVKPGILRR